MSPLPPIQRLSWVANARKPHTLELAQALTRLCKRSHLPCQQTHEYPLPPGFLQPGDWCGVLGGDGTLLGVVDQALAADVPVFGINQGKLGFLAVFDAKDILETWDDFINGGFRLEQRSVLVCHTAQRQVHALNDVVIKSHGTCGLAQLQVDDGQDRITQYTCDGLIVCTPTGSTAYNLSAAGPLMHPCCNAFAMTPICPHTLSNRTVVFPGEAVLTLGVTLDNPLLYISIDGQLFAQGTEVFPVTVGLAPRRFKLIQRRDEGYFQILRTKLRWG
jgi:NAD+ kinase